MLRINAVLHHGLWVLLLAAVFLPARAASDAELVAKGKYLATAGDCVACHTARGGVPFAGGRSLATPFGSVYAPNITPDSKSGIGGWSFDDFWQALHAGKRADASLLYPVFPYTSFTRVTVDDARAIYAYLKSLPAVRNERAANRMDFPYNLRPLLLVWRALFFEPGVYQPDNKRSDKWNRGAYLVQGLGHCNQCHSTRNALGAMHKEPLLAGGEMPQQGWYAPNLSMQPGGGLAGWTQADVVMLLKTGASTKGAVFGPMAEVVRRSTQHLTHDDLEAIAVYLQTLPPPSPAPAPSSVPLAPAALEAGRAIYVKQCSACHGKQGEGAGSIYPPLRGNSTVLAPVAINVVRSVLLGGFAPVTHANPMPYSMPPFARQLNDAQIAQVVNYIRQSWGNMAATVTAAEVAKYRYLPLD